MNSQSNRSLQVRWRRRNHKYLIIVKGTAPYRHTQKALFFLECEDFAGDVKYLRRTFRRQTFFSGNGSGRCGWESSVPGLRRCWCCNLELLNLSRRRRTRRRRGKVLSRIDWKALVCCSTVSVIYVIIKYEKNNSQSQMLTRLNDVPLLLSTQLRSSPTHVPSENKRRLMNFNEPLSVCFISCLLLMCDRLIIRLAWQLISDKKRRLLVLFRWRARALVIENQNVGTFNRDGEKVLIGTPDALSWVY